MTEAPIRRPLLVLLLVAAALQYLNLMNVGRPDFGLLIPSHHGLAFNSMALRLLEGRFDVDPQAIGVEAVHRLIEPQAIDAAMALPVAVLGLLINGVMLWMLHGERDQINARAALLHVIGDFAGSVIAIVAITLAWTTGWTRADPLLSLLLCLLMLVSTWRVLRDSSRVLMNAAPESLDVQAVVGDGTQADVLTRCGEPFFWGHEQVECPGFLLRWLAFQQQNCGPVGVRFGALRALAQAARWHR